MKVHYKVIRVAPNESYNNCLQELENALNDGYMIERVEEIRQNGKNGDYTTKDYILFKLEYEDER
ncbi:MAG: hypothetical protein II988_07320 [Clostridia bacterium]|nr:hypothetical protein [Clostridia bacterium]MBQ3597597.1 hypothetical protein [Clostridia bacterium]